MSNFTEKTITADQAERLHEYQESQGAIDAADLAAHGIPGDSNSYFADPVVNAHHADRGNRGGAEKASPKGGSSGGIRVVSMSDVRAKSIDWLKQDDLPLGMLTVIAGPPGCGKTFLTMGYMAALVSAGRDWFDGSPCPLGDVLLITGEDDLARTIKPRLVAHGADCSRVRAVTLDPDPDADPADPPPRMFMLSDVAMLDGHLAGHPETKLVVIDPVSAFHGGTDGNDNAKMRDLLSPLRGMAERRGACIILVTHLRKATGIEAVNAVVGSIGLVGAARAAWLVAKDKENPDRRYFVPIKNNLGNDRRGYAYSIERGVVTFDPDPVEKSGDDVLTQNQSAPDEDERARPRDEASAWLADYLKDGPRSWDDQAVKAGKQAGHSARTLERCRGLVAGWYKPEGYQGRTFWRLKDDDREEPVPDTPPESGEVAKYAQHALIAGQTDHTPPPPKPKKPRRRKKSHTSPTPPVAGGEVDAAGAADEAESHTSPLRHSASEKGADDAEVGQTADATDTDDTPARDPATGGIGSVGAVGGGATPPTTTPNAAANEPKRVVI